MLQIMFSGCTNSVRCCIPGNLLFLLMLSDYNFVLGKLPATIGANLVANSVTAVGVISGCVFAGDPFGWYTAVGVTLTITGVCLSSLGSKPADSGDTGIIQGVTHEKEDSGV